MDAYECAATKLDFREFDSRNVPREVKLKVLEAARLSGTGLNNQHWRFVLVQERDNLKRLAEDSTTGGWVGGASFAVIILTDPKYGFHLIDAGRACQNMQIAAWNFGVVSCLYTGVSNEGLRRDFNLPANLNPSIVVGFGYPARKITGKRKNRKPLSDLVYVDKFGDRFEPGKVT